MNWFISEDKSFGIDADTVKRLEIRVDTSISKELPTHYHEIHYKDGTMEGNVRPDIYKELADFLAEKSAIESRSLQLHNERLQGIICNRNK